ncbi:polysaccharide pyruvyl transferase family protein [Estrella lausannensis]|uniref:Polysaccharide pyruvyl transferase n=1 Tax=Estrella lausannensis TaxID=483423 RepID=A0A0H5DRF5_9BACT|nr:polysaccharide pyruvyl transferase family protein [Estrella lausannensis]CRX38264.1 Polysaccharide pyruvyl transferase [Estrella lausannensis]
MNRIKEIKLKSITILVTISLFYTNFLGAAFGYVSYTSLNIGDDIQALAAKQFLPDKSVPIDREFIGEFTYPEPVHAIINGWFMHTKDFCWYRPDVAAPLKSWPPSPFIDPMLISIHLTDGFIPFAFTEEAVQYMKNHGPVGARDYPTLHELQKRGIPSYFSGCLTLTLKNIYNERENIIYAVDLDKECLDYLRAHTKAKVIPITHSIHHEMFLKLTNEQRMSLANTLLKRYMKAKCVVTGRLHASMPCLGLETPVLLIRNNYDPRFDGLGELAHRCSKEELLSGSAPFDFDNPPKNPEHYKVIRENLIQIVSEWVQQKIKKSSS